MAKMPELVELRAKLGDRLVVLGINFDDDVEVARAAIAEHGLNWPQVHAPTAAAGGEFWERVTGIRGLPRVFIVDGAGVLRADVYPHDLAAAVEPFLPSGAADRR